MIYVVRENREEYGYFSSSQKAQKAIDEYNSKWPSHKANFEIVAVQLDLPLIP